jgi:STIP1 family protein 1
MDLQHASTKLREKGNNYYSRSEYDAAIRAYDQALEYTPNDPILFYNKAICFLKLKDYDLAIQFSDKSIALDAKAMKGYYYKAQAFEQKGLLSEAEKAYDKAIVLAKEKSVSSQLINTIHVALQNVRRTIYEQTAQQENETRKQLYTYVLDIMRRQNRNEQDDHYIKTLQLESLFNEFDQLKISKDAPDYFCCKITFDVMRDPVTTPSGITYERAAIEEHLSKNSFDPVTRASCKISDLRPNLALREAIEEFLKKNPFA